MKTMPEKDHIRRRLYLAISASGMGVLVVVAVIWMLLSAGSGPNAKAEPISSTQELKGLLSPERFQSLTGEKRTEYFAALGRRMAAVPREQRRQMFEEAGLREQMDTMESEDRRALWQGMRGARRRSDDRRDGEGGGRGRGGGRMRERMEEFFAASESEQKAILDEMIDRFAEFRRRRADRGNDRGEDSSHRRRRNISDDQRDERFRRMLGHVEPEDRAKFQEFFRRLRERAEERGVEFGGPGRRGR